MTFLLVLLIIIAVWLIFSPYIKPWLRRRAERKLADYLRAQMGMPTEKETRRARREADRHRTTSGNKKGFWTRPAYNASASSQHAPDELIPREYAVDVEYTEIKQFSQTTIGKDAPEGKSFVTESQVSDVEYTEIKIKNA